MRRLSAVLHTLALLVLSAHAAKARDGRAQRTWYKSEPLPVTCLNRTIETGEHITDQHGNLQYIPFLRCNETGNAPLSFPYGAPTTQTCTLDLLSDEFYHLLEYFVHSDVPLSCRVPAWPLDEDNFQQLSDAAADAARWTPLTIALQGTLQLSHLHLHTSINVLFHTVTHPAGKKRSLYGVEDTMSHLIASTAYSIPDPAAPREGAKILRNEPLQFTFNVGWVEGNVLPGMMGKPLRVKDHGIGFSLLSFFAVVGSAGVGALGMLFYERRKSGRGVYGNGLLGGNVGGGANGAATRSTGYGGYGGYGGYSGATGKRD